MSHGLDMKRAIACLVSTGLVVFLLGCSSSSSHPSTPASSTGSTGSPASASGPWGWPGTAQTGYLPPHEPDVNKDGTVKIGLITAGDITDHGYYQSEVDTLKQFATQNHWATPIVQGLVNPAQAAQAAQNMCQQHVDLVLVGESELAAAGPAASSSVCHGIPFWVYASQGTMPPSKYYYLAEDAADPQSYVTGVAMGLWMKEHNTTVAGFIAGPALSFTERPARAYFAGMRSIVPKAKLLTTFTGDFNASGPAITAAQSMITKGVKLIFPYLGGALFPTAQYIVKNGGAVISDGGNYCSSQGVNFDIRQVYDPGYYLPYALQEFANGTMRVGVVKLFNFGLTPVPTVQFCHPAGAENNATLNNLITQIGQGKINSTAIINAAPQP
jgi:basic membrane protein A and related proteins